MPATQLGWQVLQAVETVHHVSEQMTRPRWPLLLVLLVLTAAFAWVFIISVDRAKSERSSELSLEMSGTPLSSPDLQITPKLGTLPPDSPANRSLPQPAPWWPALLFGLAFLCGWLYRHGTPTPLSDHSSDTDETPVVRQLEEIQEHVIDMSGNATASNEDLVPYTAIRAAGSPDLHTDFPWDEAMLDDTQGLTSEEHIARLHKQNASKAEIIKALERLVTENREKWLHQDETEYRLNNHIQTLSDDLRVAIRQLQRLQADSPSATGSHKKVI